MCKFIPHCYTAQICLETVALMGALYFIYYTLYFILYLEPTAECNLGVGHFHEVAWWSPYHTSQKASHMKYETHQLGNTQIFQQQPFGEPSFDPVQDHTARYPPSTLMICWLEWPHARKRGQAVKMYCWRLVERKFLVIAELPTFQHLRISASVVESYHAMIWKHSDL